MGWISRRFRVGAAAVMVCGVAAGYAHGNGYEVADQSARGTAQANAYAAQADDPSAIYYNPAGLTQLPGTQLTLGSYFFFPDFNLYGPAGHEQTDQWAALPHLYLSSDLGTDNWRVGLGINNVFGLTEDWGQGVLRTVVSEAHLYTVNIAPTVAFKFDEHLSFGAELNVYWADALLKRNVILGPPPTPEGEFRFSGTGMAVGATLGAMWKINEKHTLAAVYRSPFEIEFDGDARVRGTPLGPSDTSIVLDFPQMVILAYAYRPVKPWKLEVDVEFTNWETFDRVTFESHDPAFGGQSIPVNWLDTLTFRFGTQYDVNEHWSLRAGYAFGQNSMPESTFSPLIPDSNFHAFCIGAGYSTRRWSLDLAYQYIFREHREIDNSINSPAVNGEWENQSHALMISLTWRF